jgi:hypothetical protein
MSNTEFNSENMDANAGHVATAESFYARMEEIRASGAAPEMCNNALVASGFPPEMCATAHSEGFRNGAPYPDIDTLPEDHPVLATLNDYEGVYNDNVLMEYLQEALGPAAPRLDSVFLPMPALAMKRRKNLTLISLKPLQPITKGQHSNESGTRQNES